MTTIGATGNILSAKGNAIMLLLVALDVLGALLIFNSVQYLYTGEVGALLLMTWKLVLIVAINFLCNYLMDLYTFNSPLSRLGMMERSLIAMLATGIGVAIAVYVIGPGFIGGFVGRGVLAISLLFLWLWSLSVRYILNIWLQQQRSQVTWLLLADDSIDDFLPNFRSIYSVERLLVLTPQSGTEIHVDDAAVSVLGDWESLDQVLASHAVTGVIVAAPEKISTSLIDDLMANRIRGLRIYTMSDFYEDHLSRLPVFHLNQQWIAMTHGFELIHNPIGLRFKRYLDVAIALVVGTLALPLIVGSALAVLLTAGRPVLYHQIRTGENGEPFTVIKFRTMVTDAEADGARFAAHNDPRVTPVGGFMRKYRLDELPQLWNVLVGDMSFIGPRPERPEFIADLEQRIPYYNLRHLVKPGITGWAQVMYGYGDSAEDSAEKLQYDLFYIKNYSLVLDISIMVRSIKVVLFGTGR